MRFKPIVIDTTSRNANLLESFVNYCNEHPSERFWQALRNWSGFCFVGVSNDKGQWTDTFYWNEKGGRR